MAVNLSDENVQKFKSGLSAIQNTIVQWDAPCESIKHFLTGDVGTTFHENFGTGRKAQQAINGLVEILQEMETSIKTLLSDTETYLDNYKAEQDSTF